MTGYLFEHHFEDGMGPFVTRFGIGQDTPTSVDAATVVSGKLELRLLADPLRVGHVWVPPEEFSFTEGRVEARMRFPSPPGVHSAVWLQSPTPYATAEDHEVDIGEHFGDDKNVYHSLWTGPWPPEQPYKKSARLTPAKWNVYSADCRKGGYTFKINGVEVGRTQVKGGGFGSTRPKALILSLLADDFERPKLDLTRLADYYALCDWVRVAP